MFENYNHKFELNGKFIFIPNREAKRRGDRIIDAASELKLPDYFYHYRRGGHVTALHSHIQNTFFFKIDLKNFFYSVSRNRIARALHEYDLGLNPRIYAQWSTVKNPYPKGPRYVLPIGFAQSPILASLAMLQSPLDAAIREANRSGVFVSVYFDDLIGSGNSRTKLIEAFTKLLFAIEKASFEVNRSKLIEPAEAIVAFNCDLAISFTKVADSRRQKFLETNPSEVAKRSFEAYATRVECKNG